MPAASAPVLAPPGGPWRNAAEGALAAAGAFAVMAATAWAALLALDADDIAPLSRLVPALLSLACGGDVSLSATASPSGDGPATGLLGMLGGGEGLTVGLEGQVTAMPLTLTFLGATVLGLGFFRPLRRRARPAPALLVARTGGAVAVAVLLLPLSAALARGTARLPEEVTGRLGNGGRIGSLADDALSSVTFRADAATTVLLGLLGLLVVLGGGCVAARRTTLPRPLALSRLRLRWNPVASALTAIGAAVSAVVLAAAAVAAVAALTGADRAATATGTLLLAGANLPVVLLTSGLGASWQAGIRREQSDGGGLLGMLGGSGRTEGGAADRNLTLGQWSGAGLPLWLIGLVLLTCLLVLAGYLAAARTPVRTAREEADALLGRHLELALRTATAVALAVMPTCLAAQGSLRLGVSVMDNALGGVTAGLDGAVRLSGLTAFVLTGLAAYAGSRLHGLRAGRRDTPAPTARGGTRPPARTGRTGSSGRVRVPSDSASATPL
ncbi:streptophobe family protein [Streptomyces sp. NPDC052610]|uniref:streptophobe family protein n=1 Tax=Streptomyces sp. NPDC052610 TaxID=3154952 RepID=UPI00342E76C4